MRETDVSSLKDRLITLIIVGVMSLAFGVYQLFIIWTPKSSLIPLKGVVENCDTYVTNVSSTGRNGYEAKSRRAELVLYLKEHQKKFALMENIEAELFAPEHEHIKRRLRQSQSATVWVKKTEVDEWQPKVFQIDTDTGTVLQFDAVRYKERPLTVFLILFGLTCICGPMYLLSKNRLVALKEAYQ